MPDVRAQLIISARDEASATMKGVGSATKETGVSLMDLYAGVRLAEMGLRAIKGAFDAVINPTLTLADETRKLQNTIGGTAEDAGKLIYAADKTGVSFATLETGLKASIRALQSHKSEGIEPNIQGLATLSDRYLAIQDPIQKTAFLMHNFGRSGADLAQFMKLGGDAIRDMGSEAAATGVVMSQQGVNSAYQYEQSVRQLDAAWTGFKVHIGEQVIPALTGLAKAMNDQVSFQALVTQAQKSGIDTSKIVQQTTQDGIVIITNQKEATFELNLALGAQVAAEKQVTDASDRLRGSQSDSVPVMRAMVDNVTALVDRYPAMTEGARKLADASAKSAQALQDQNDKLALQAGLAGTVTNGWDAYLKTVNGNFDQMTKLENEITKLTAAQGSNVVVVDKGKYSAEQLTVAQERLAIAEQRLSEYHGKSKASLESLQLSVRTARDAVDKMAASQATASTTTADFTTKIAADKDALAKLQDQNNQAAAAMEKANAQLVYQQVVAELDNKSALALAHQLGLLDDATYNLAIKSQALGDAYKAGTITLDQFTAGEKDLADSAGASAGAVQNLAEQIASLHDKTVTVTVNQNGNYGGQYGSGGPGYTGGGSGTSTPIVTPPGGGGGTTGGGYVNPAANTPSNNSALTAAIHNLPSAISRAVRDGLQGR